MTQFSPRGDRIAFLAALPFDFTGLYYKKQIQVWMYDLETADVTQLTNDTWSYNNMSWNGHNTFPHDPEVTVDNTTVTFDEVEDEGLTTIIRDDDPPELPVGYEVCGEFYEITTTADIEGPISVCMTYEDEDVPPGTAEEDLTILHYVEDGDYWQDITVSVDTENNVVCGETESLSVFTLSGLRPASFPDVPSTGLGLGGADGHWAFDAVEACVAASVVSGYPDGLYRPDRPVTRDQMAVYISRSLTGEAGIPAGPDTPTFPDVPADYWAYDSIEYAVSSDVVTGYPNGYYRPDYDVSRAQMAVFVARAQGWVAIDDDMTTAPDLFPDVPAGHWAGTPIEACVENGVVNGYPDGLYRPHADVTRDQMAVYMARAFDLIP
jgi:hypothetical protein